MNKYKIGDLVKVDHPKHMSFIGEVLTVNETEDSVYEYTTTNSPWVVQNLQRLLLWEKELTLIKRAK